MQSGNRQKILISYFKSLNKIFKLEIKKDNEELISEQLKNVSSHVKEIFNLDDKEHFETLMLSAKEESRQFAWNQEEYSKPFIELMKLCKTSYIGSMDKQNKNLWLQTALNLNELLEFLTPDLEEKKEFIGYGIFLDLFFSIHREIFHHSIKTKSIYRDSLGYHWYTGRVFNWIHKQYKFNLQFLSILDKQLFEYIKFSIDNDDFDFFKSLIEWFHSGIGFYDNMYSGLYEFIDFRRFGESIDFGIIDQLDSEFNNLSSINALNAWIDKFNKIKEIVCSLDSDKYNEADEILRNAQDQYLFNNLRKLVHGVGAYLVYREKYKWINYLWHFKQPKDTETTWCGHSIIPETVEQLLKMLETRDGFSDKFGFRDGHSESPYYYIRYELLFLSFLISNNHTVSFSLRYVDGEVNMSNLRYYVEKLEKTSSEIYKDTVLLDSLSIQVPLETVQTMLINIKDACSKAIDSIVFSQSIREDRRSEFKNSFFEAYKKADGIKKLTKCFTKTFNIQHKTNSSQFGINTLLPKDMFTSDMVMGTDYIGSQYGNDLASGENRTIIEAILAMAEPIQENEFSNAVKKISILSDIFIVAFGSFKFFMNNSNFEGAWNLQEDVLKDFSSFEGRYIVNDYRIPVFRIHYGQITNRVLILNKKKFLDITQYEIDNTNEDGIAFNLDEISNEIKNKILEKLPTEDAKKQKEEELKKQVHLQISESFEVKLHNDFEGYIIDL
jgi:hypothetical protein